MNLLACVVVCTEQLSLGNHGIIQCRCSTTNCSFLTLPNPVASAVSYYVAACSVVWNREEGVWMACQECNEGERERA